MNTTKKSYTMPQLNIHGTVAELTQTYGVSVQDVPKGTPVGTVAGAPDGSHP
jgi:hypothetical protein